MNGWWFYIAIAALVGVWFLGKSSGYESGHKAGVFDAPAYFASIEAEKQRAEVYDHERDLARAAAQPSMMQCMKILGVDVTAIEEAVREDMIEDSMTADDLRSDYR